MQVASHGLSEEEFDESDLSDVQCCHIRLFNELVCDHLPSIFCNISRSENRLVSQLELMKDHINDPVCHLPTPSNRSFLFIQNMTIDVHVDITDNRLSCQSGYYDALF